MAACSQINALMALQEATEAFVVGLMEATQMASIHRGRITIGIKDMNLVRRYMEMWNVGSGN